MELGDRNTEQLSLSLPRQSLMPFFLVHIDSFTLQIVAILGSLLGVSSRTDQLSVCDNSFPMFLLFHGICRVWYATECTLDLY
mgnify:CR=1 FL=1